MVWLCFLHLTFVNIHNNIYYSLMQMEMCVNFGNTFEVLSLFTWWVCVHWTVQNCGATLKLVPLWWQPLNSHCGGGLQQLQTDPNQVISVLLSLDLLLVLGSTLTFILTLLISCFPTFSSCLFSHATMPHTHTHTLHSSYYICQKKFFQWGYD